MRATAPSTAPKQSEREILGKLTLDALRAIPPVAVINTLFPQHYVEDEVPGKSWKVSIPAGHLHIDFGLFNLLEDPENKRFSGKGGIDCHMCMSGKARDDKNAFRTAVESLTKAFYPYLLDGKVPTREKITRLEKELAAGPAMTPGGKNQTGKTPKKVQDLPDRASSPRDVAEARDYMEKARGLPSWIVDHCFRMNAVYPARPPSKFRDGPGPLRLVFPLLNYKTLKPESFSMRSVFGKGKKNEGDKMRAGFHIGSRLEPGQTAALFPVESPIEALSRYVLLREQLKTRPDLLARCCIVGVNGNGRQLALLERAKEIGVGQVFAGYNNDYAGRKLNANLVADAESVGVPATVDLVPGGEVQLRAIGHELSGQPFSEFEAAVKKLGLPMKETGRSPKSVTVQCPLRAELADLINASNKAMRGYHVITGQFEPSVLKQREELAAKLKTAGLEFNLAEPAGQPWKISLLNTPEAMPVVNAWRNANRSIPAIQAKPDLVDVDFFHLLQFEFLNKDWNDELRGRPGTIFPDFAEPGIDVIQSIEHAIELQRQQRPEIGAPEVS